MPVSPLWSWRFTVNCALPVVSREAIFTHFTTVAAAFFGGLKNHHDGAIEVTRLGEIFGGAEQHSGVTVVTAGVHQSLVLRSVGQVGGFDDGQRIHVGAQPDNAAAGSLATVNHADDARATEPGSDLVAAERPEFFRHKRRSAVRLEQQFRVLVQLTVPCGDCRMEFNQTGNNGHALIVIMPVAKGTPAM